jgi:hypothetical protein
MENAMTRNSGMAYEQLTQQMFQAILDQDIVQSIKVDNNVRLDGILTSHQVDIFWEFSLGDVNYKTVVEVKDRKEAIDQGEVMKFKAVLDDLPGQPRGIIVSRSGFQAGARRLASANGILLYELRSPTESDLKGRVRSLVLTLISYHPMASDIRLVHDNEWRISEAVRLGLHEAPRLQLTLEPHEALLLDNGGKQTGTVQDVINGLYPEGLHELLPTRVRREFSQPIFLDTRNPAFPKLKLSALEATISTSGMEQEVVVDVNEFVGYILKETLTGAVQTFDRQLQRRLAN